MRALPTHKIKFELQLFLSLLVLLTVVGSWFLYKNFYQFDVKIYEKSKNNIQVLDSLTRIQEAVRDQNELMVVHEFKFLEKFNSEVFPDVAETSNFQNLFYSVWQNADAWLKNTQTTGIADESLPLVMAGLDQLASSYSGLFWSSAQSERGWLSEQSQNYLVFFGVGAGVLILLALYTSIKVYRYFRYQEHREELFSIVGTRDFNTGLFNRMSFDTLALQEMSRAKRKGYGFSILLLRIEHYEQIVADFGQLAGDRLLYQISEIIKSFRRSYDGVFKYSENCFAVVLVEVDREKMRGIEARLNAKFSEKSFIITHDQTKIVPHITVGFAVYPYDGEELQALLHVAEHGLHDSVGKSESEPEDSAEKFPDSFLEGAKNLSSEEEVSENTQDEIEMVQIPESVDSIIDKYSGHTVSPEAASPEVFQESATDLIISDEYRVLVPENEVPIENMPDVVLALTQDEETLQKLSSESLEKKRRREEKIIRETVAKRQPYRMDGMTEQLVQSITKQYNRESERSGFGNIPQIEIIKDEQQEDIIMVDFDRDKTDLAEKFRRRLKAQKEL